jgi:hypothetical protein
MTDTSENIAGNQEIDLNWKNRRLCIDESCIGVIGADGRCRVCELLHPCVPESLDICSGMSTVGEALHEKPSEDQVSETKEPEWEDRTLCRDESCIGTIGTDGRCRICGLAG